MFRARFRSLFLAAFCALWPAGLVALVAPYVGTVVFIVVGAALWVAIDTRMP